MAQQILLFQGECTTEESVLIASRLQKSYYRKRRRFGKILTDLFGYGEHSA